MKKLLLSVAVIATMGFASCGEDKKETGPTFCDCVTMDKPSEECKTMEKEFKAKMKDASDEEKEEMIAEVEACKSEKKTDEDHDGHDH
jgi:hypothetical protein